MLPDPFLQFAPNRAESVLRRLRTGLWLDRREIPVTATCPTVAHRKFSEIQKERRTPIKRRDVWGKLYEQRWFHIELPAADRKKSARYLEWRDQGEATLYVDSVPYYGFDPAHRYVALPSSTKEVWIEGYCCQSGIWHPQATGISEDGSLFGGAFIQYRDDLVWDCVNEMQVLFDLMMTQRAKQHPAPKPWLNSAGLQATVELATPLYRKILHLLELAADAYELRGVAALRDALVVARAELKNDKPLLRAALTGHAHIDLVWIWPERMAEAKAVHTFSTMNRLMALYPEFRFAYSQPASYRAVERRTPELMTLVKKQIARGTWQPTGGLDVESDTLLPCGEALARSFTLGQAEFARLRKGADARPTSRAPKERALPSRLVWLPDVFGYSACLPQLMRLAGIDWFFTTKMTWSGVNRFPYSSFVWRGNDGSEVVSHVTQNVGYCNRTEISEIEDNALGHIQSPVHSEFLHPTGHGDGGGGPTEEMCERVRRLSGLVDLPELHWDHPEAFFERLEKLRASLPVYQGECYLEYHRGVYTTHGDFKAIFRAAERALQVREAVAVATGENPDLTDAWRRVVFTQFHDFIPGSSIAEVYHEGRAELSKIASEQLTAAHAALASKKKSADQIFNPHALMWRGWVGERFFEIPPLSSVAVSEGKTAKTAAAVTATKATLTSDRIKAKLTADGRLASLVVDAQPIAFAAPAAEAVLYSDNPANYEAWDLDRHTLDLGKRVDTPVTVTIEQSSPHCAALCVTRKLGEASTLTLRYEVRSGEGFLRITADVDWHESFKLLKLHFPTDYKGRFARFAAPYGSILRGQQPGEPIAEAQWEVPGSRWAAVSLDGEREGLALVTEAKYGFSARDGDLSVSLLRSAFITAAEGSPYMHAAPPHLSHYQPDSPLSDQGRHTIALALAPYSAEVAQERHPAVLADTLFTLPVAYRGAAVSAGLRGVLNAPTLIPAWVVPLEDGAWLLRLHEVGGARGTARLDLAEGLVARACSDLEGQHYGRVQRDFGYGPYQILSLRIERSENE